MTLGRHSRAGLLLILAAACGGGCDSAAPGVVPVASERGIGVPTDVDGPTENPAPGAAPQDPTRRRAPPPPRDPADRIGVPGIAPSAVPTAPSDPTPAAGPPDYSNALRTAFGTPTDCISAETRGRLQGRLTVSVSARVTPSGRVISANVSGSGLGPEDLACMTRRAQAMQLSGPIEGAPRTVRASITYEIASTPATPGREGGWELDWGPSSPSQGTLPPGAQAPGIVTPARGPSGPAPGSVAPDVTLPAQGSTTHPPGYVPPDSTLPAQGR
ncbi:MAG: hypothetical protein R3B82_10010 [Sandaracinaceae bacterium]